MMCVSQMIMLFTLNLYCAVCQLYLNKTGEKRGGNHFVRILQGDMGFCLRPEATPELPVFLS